MVENNKEKRKVYKNTQYSNDTQYILNEIIFVLFFAVVSCVSLLQQIPLIGLEEKFFIQPD